MNKVHELFGAMGAIVVSVIVLTAFGVVCWMVFFKEIPPSSHDIALVLFGALSAMSANVVSYWTGSSSGSQKKDATISDLAKMP